jgi:co-chaperonin GroES (HSP10)
MITKINKLIGDRIMLTHSVSRMRGVIEIPEYIYEHTASCMILKVGSKVKIPIKSGDKVLCQSGIGSRMHLKEGNVFLAREENIIGLISGQAIIPFGNKLLIKRDKKGLELQSGILIPENKRGQSLGGTIVGFGVSRSKVANGAEVGDYILLKEWEPHMIEVQLPDKSYGLIVNQSDVICVVEKGVTVTHKNQTYQP